MSRQNKNISRVWKEIQRVLTNVWDPIGVKDIAGAKDEYDSYIGGIYSLLLKGAKCKELEDYLYTIETKNMGLHGESVGRIAAVKELLKINIK